LLDTLSWITLGVDALSAVIGAVAVAHWGWALAMGLSIWTGQTEPVRPQIPFPWVIWAACLACGAAGAGVRAVFRGRVAIFGSLLAHGGVLAAVAVPLVHLWRLWRVAAGG
jgi:hypothetical protein